MSLSPSIFLNLLIAGIFLGGIYSLVSIGLTLIFGTLKLVNFAHGALMMLSMYLTFWLWSLLNIDPLISLPISFGLFFWHWLCLAEGIDHANHRTSGIRPNAYDVGSPFSHTECSHNGMVGRPTTSGHRLC